MQESTAPSADAGPPNWQAELARLDCRDNGYATEFVDTLLAAAQSLRASDVHLQPTPGGLDVAWRIDGVLQRLGRFPRGGGSDVVTRLKVMASLLTYRTDLPQEGRIADRGAGRREVEMRVSTFPTLHGERAVVRLLAARQDLRRLGDLGLGPDLGRSLQQTLQRTSGAVLVTGPAGSGKTTTLYACLREIAAQSAGARSLMTLEDPIESALDGVSQSQVNESAGLTLAAGVRSMLRQDPEVIMIGEIRDHETAAAAIGASLTGHLVLSSFHAGTAAAALRRLADMSIEAYMLRSGLLGVLSQRLVRRLCPGCSRQVTAEADKLQLEVAAAREAVGCRDCRGTGYDGRMLLSEWLCLQQHPLTAAQLRQDTAAELQAAARRLGMRDLWEAARQAVEAGGTSPAEVRRVLGWS